MKSNESAPATFFSAARSAAKFPAAVVFPIDGISELPPLLLLKGSADCKMFAAAASICRAFAARELVVIVGTLCEAAAAAAAAAVALATAT